jgi:hypothetical protein
MSDAPSSAPVAAPPGGDVGRDNSQDRKAGYTPMPAERTAPKQPQREEREFATGREAADALAKRRRQQGQVPDAPRPVSYSDGKGYTAPANETITIERGADDLKQSRLTDAAAKEIHDRHDIAFQVDEMRAKAGVPTDPTAPVDPDQINPHVFGDLPYQAPQIDPKDLQPPPPGVDPDLHLAFQNPKVRQAVEAEVTRANAAEVAFGDGLKVAQNAAVASFAAHYPEFVGKSPAQIQAAFAQMQQQNPQRAQQAQAAFQNAIKFEAALNQNEARRQHAEQQNFQRFAKEQDLAFDKAIGQRTPQQRQALAGEMVAMAADYGINRETLVHLMQTSPIMRHAGMQRVFHEAAAGRLARKQLATLQQQQRAANVPHVTPPGTSNGGARAVQSASLNALRQKLDATGSAKDAAALLVASRNAKRR